MSDMNIKKFNPKAKLLGDLMNPLCLPKTETEDAAVGHINWLLETIGILQQQAESLRQRNEELEAKHAGMVEVYERCNQQIIAQQLTIENMREAFQAIWDSYMVTGEPSPINAGTLAYIAKDALSIQPSTAELETHDDVSGMKLLAQWKKDNTPNKVEIERLEAIRQRKTS